MPPRPSSPPRPLAAALLAVWAAAALSVLGCGAPDRSPATRAAREPTVDDAIAAGVRALRGGQPEEALVAFRDATERFGEAPRAWRGRARAALRADRPGEACEASHRALEFDDGAETWELAGWASAAAARHAEAAERFDAALERDPSRGHLYFALGRAHERAGADGRAADAYAASADAGVLAARSHLARGRVLLDAIVATPRPFPARPLRFQEVETSLDAAERTAGEEEALQAAIVAQRRRLEIERNEDRDGSGGLLRAFADSWDSPTWPIAGGVPPPGDDEVSALGSPTGEVDDRVLGFGGLGLRRPSGDGQREGMGTIGLGEL